MLLIAKYVVPVGGRPVKDGFVRIEHDRIAETGTTRHLDVRPFGPVVDLGDAVILPGLVNAHTHLELTHHAGAVPPGPDFIDWLERLRNAAVERDPEDQERAFADAAREGMMLSVTAGVTTVGDITSRPAAVRSVLRHGPLRVVSFGEVIATGTIRGRLADRLQAAIDPAHASDHLAVAVSPHAPYTIEPDGVRACVGSARRLDLRVCMHLAETPDEARYTERGDGPFRDFLQRLGVWDDVIRCPRLAPVPLAYSCGLLDARTLLAHCNYVTDEDIRLIARCGAHVVYCPRTHHAFGHPPHRFREMLAAGVNVCLGTDSLASNPSLSILDEMRFLRRSCPELDGPTLLELATVRGARALGISDVGCILHGYRADLTAVPLSPGLPRDPIKNLLESTLNPVLTLIAGRRVAPKPNPE